jgi:hypothetical protein
VCVHTVENRESAAIDTLDELRAILPAPLPSTYTVTMTDWGIQYIRKTGSLCLSRQPSPDKSPRLNSLIEVIRQKLEREKEKQREKESLH